MVQPQKGKLGLKWGKSTQARSLHFQTLPAVSSQTECLQRKKKKKPIKPRLPPSPNNKSLGKGDILRRKEERWRKFTLPQVLECLGMCNPRRWRWFNFPENHILCKCIWTGRKRERNSLNVNSSFTPIFKDALEKALQRFLCLKRDLPLCPANTFISNFSWDAAMKHLIFWQWENQNGKRLTEEWKE